ncbi:GntR family transcriptional regulator [Marinitenerispora sediminis]|uniref:GntR family transcriptional regulator n=1 Tax=Marinitenerispora sediminis TaxID=1931232 RepID=A0A368T9T4_9ACTN|nr:GntR family transcriptional regulator [Marinitenerispora sediminis]RCV52457.1 GntR family transcriptional regulator [Marinitenerispora sediminis]RCV54962.1 GntR family transcriptional regulator [Marinitenerispora sediminis]RCV61425.1 GntR family transcriptional regulator [Marinitenerispora sediminis]
MGATSESHQLPSRRIAEDLRRAIESKTLPEGAKLPSERVLAQEYGTARNTAREAIRLLVEQGLVDVQHGRGVFVRRKHRRFHFGSERYSRRLREETGLSPYRAELAKQGRTAHVDCTSITHVKPPPEVAERLAVDHEADSVVRRENWYYADGEPVQIGVTFIPLAIAEGSVLATSANMGRGSLYARFEELGYPIARIREEIAARMPTPAESRNLSIPDGVPVLEVLHTGITGDGTPFEVTRFVMRADLNGLDYNMPVED